MVTKLSCGMTLMLGTRVGGRVPRQHLELRLQTAVSHTDFRLLCTSCALETRHSVQPPPPGDPTHYENLGLDASASSKQIKNAFIDLSKKYHPDMNPGDPDAGKRFHEITEAYGVLNNPVLRRKYDRGRLGKFSSIADKEAASHTYEGEVFDSGREAFRKEYAASHKGEMDSYVKYAATRSFNMDQMQRRFQRSSGSTLHRHQTHGASSFVNTQKQESGGSAGKVVIFVVLFAILLAVLR